MEILDPIIDENQVSQRLEALVRYHDSARRTGVQLLNRLGSSTESAFQNLPSPLRTALVSMVDRALMAVMQGAHKSRDVVADESGMLTRGLTTLMGVAGGLGGLPTALIELPVTTGLLLRSIQDVAAELGFDPADPGVQFECVSVLSSSGPMSDDDGADLAFFSTRLALSGTTARTLIRQIAPRLAAMLSQKLAAQALPLIGAAAGAGTNTLFMLHFRNMARVHFGLRRLSMDADIPVEELIAKFREMSKG